MKYSTVLFDLDGTLTDPVQGICGSVRYALEKAGRPIGPIESYHKYIGPPLLRSFEVYANATPEEAQELLGYYRERFSTVGLFENEVYPGIPELLRDLKAAGYGVWGLTNWSHETFHFAFEKFPQLAELLQDTVVSGMEKMHKPNADIYELAMSRFGLSPESSVFLDDTAKNVAGARSAGMHAFRFVDTDQARRDLESLGVRV